MGGSDIRFASGGRPPRPRWRDTRQTARFLSEKGGEFEGCPLERVEGRQPFSRSEP